jgi:hypothetical protein
VALQWGHPLASTPSVIGPMSRVCGALCGHGEHWFPCPRRAPFYIRLRERGATATLTAGAPIRVRDGDPSINGEITFVTFSPLISTSHT